MTILISGAVGSDKVSVSAAGIRQLFGNMQVLNMVLGDRVYWYLKGMANEVDIHTAYFHGCSIDHKLSGRSYRTVMFHLSSATFQTVKMKPQYPGSWLLHCHVTDHIMAGMETIYTTIEKGEECV
ncbi:ceruloplasmin-like [Oncorhynchus mykiss]|uniref:ceruloplasmin-like n=1 Tax=Oncorhynchus mykiss TaxID=8022 RepID=UPI001878FAC4|nr:ceruloplasmin-like [Oncorhynchus mykiss]